MVMVCNCGQCNQLTLDRDIGTSSIPNVWCGRRDFTTLVIAAEIPRLKAHQHASSAFSNFPLPLRSRCVVFRL